MTCTISLEGLASTGGNEDRAIAHIDVTLNGQLYHWQTYIGRNADLSAYLEAAKTRIEAEILAKEAEWAALDPKTRSFVDPITQEEQIVDIQKDEIVRPDVPDYYALRRESYPPVVEQVSAIMKGQGSTEYIAVVEQIETVKATYPKKYMTAEEQQQELMNSVTTAVQLRLDNFARTRGYDNIMSACTYENSSVPKFAAEATYCVEVRGTTWATLYTIMGEVLGGQRAMPGSYADIEGDLPTLTWPL